MSVFVKVIPFIELLLILAILGLGSLGYLSLLNKENQVSQNQFAFAWKWILPGLLGLAILAIFLLVMVSFTQG